MAQLEPKELSGKREGEQWPMLGELPRAVLKLVMKELSPGDALRLSLTCNEVRHTSSQF